MTGNQHCCARH